MKLVFSELAIDDLRAIADYLIEEAGVDMALVVTDRIQYTIENTLFDNPEIGKQIDYVAKGKMRFFPAKNAPYNIYYTSSVNQMTIVRILHGKRDIRKILTRQEN